MKGKHLIILLIIIVSAYGSIKGLKALLQSNAWSGNDTELLIKKCMEDANKTAIDYPSITNEYCICSTEKIQQKFSKEEYLKIISTPEENQFREIIPVIENCFKELEKRIDTQQ